MQRARLPAWAGATIVVLGIVGVMVGTVVLLKRPVRHWLEQLPQSFAAAEGKLERVREPARKAADVANQLERSARGLATSTGPSTQPGQEPTTTPAVANGGLGNGTGGQPSTEEVSPAPAGMFSDVLGTTTAMLGGVVEVLVLLLLLLAGGGVFHDKLIKVTCRPASKERAERVVHDAHRAVRRYLVVTALINLVQGAVIAGVMWWLGMPAPLVWGAATFVFEFVPYLGAAVMLTLLSVV